MWRALLLLTLLSCATASPSAPTRPNVLIFLLDDVGFGDVGFLGAPYRGATPHLDAFAERAVLLDMYAGAPICSPSRASLLSGRFSDAVGMWQLQEPGLGRMALRPDALIVGNVLARAGYATAAIGKWHLSDGGFEAFGFERLRQPPTALRQGHVLREWIRNSSAPWFAYWAPHECHEPVAPRFVAPQFESRFPREPPDSFAPNCVDQTVCTRQHLPAPSGATCSTARAECPRAEPSPRLAAERRASAWDYQRRWLACVASADAAFGEMIDELRAMPAPDGGGSVEENTLVLFSSDNGPELRAAGSKEARASLGSAGPLRGWKGSVFEGGIRVPGLVAWPAGGIGGTHGLRLAPPVHFADVLPTLADAAGVAFGPAEARSLHGVNLLPALRAATRRPPRCDAAGVAQDGDCAPVELPRRWPLFWSQHDLGTPGRHDDACPACALATHAVREGRWKLLAWTGRFACDRAVMAFFANAPVTRVELYDLLADPGETTDVAAAHANQTAHMRALLDVVRAEVNLRGLRWNLDCQLPVGDPPPYAPELTTLCRCPAARLAALGCEGCSVWQRRAHEARLVRDALLPPPVVVVSADGRAGLARLELGAARLHQLRGGDEGSQLSWRAVCDARVPAQFADSPHKRAEFVVRAWLARARFALGRQLDRLSLRQRRTLRMPTLTTVTVALGDLLETDCGEPARGADGRDVARQLAVAAGSTAPALQLCTAGGMLTAALANASTRDTDGVHRASLAAGALRAYPLAAALAAQGACAVIG